MSAGTAPSRIESRGSSRAAAGDSREPWVRSPELLPRPPSRGYISTVADRIFTFYRRRAARGSGRGWSSTRRRGFDVATRLAQPQGASSARSSLFSPASISAGSSRTRGGTRGRRRNARRAHHHGGRGPRGGGGAGHAAPPGALRARPDRRRRGALPAAARPRARAAWQSGADGLRGGSAGLDRERQVRGHPREDLQRARSSSVGFRGPRRHEPRRIAAAPRARGQELEYRPVLGAVRRGHRPAKLPRLR